MHQWHLIKNTGENKSKKGTKEQTQQLSCASHGRGISNSKETAKNRKSMIPNPCLPPPPHIPPPEPNPNINEPMPKTFHLPSFAVTTQ